MPSISNKYTFIICLLFGVILNSCSYSRTEITLGSAFDSTWQFENTNNYEFDDNLVEIKNGKAQLKPLDLSHSGDDFNNGTHVGSHVLGNKINITSFKDIEFSPSWTPEYSNLKHYWSFNGSLSNEFGTDGVASNPNSTGLEYVGTKFSKGLFFDGIDDLVTFSNTYDDKLSISMWINPNDLLTGSKRILDFPPYYLWVENNEVIFYANFNGTNGVWRSSASLEVNKLSHILLTYEHDSVNNDPKLYVNNVNLSFNEISSPVGTPRTDTSTGGIGNRIGNDRAFNGLLDEVAIWNKVLTNSQVSDIFLRQSQVTSSQTELSPFWTPKWDNIVGYWKMDGNWQDSSGNGNHGTPVGGAMFSPISKVGSQSGEFDGVDDFIEVLDSGADSSIDIATGSWGGWFNVISNTTQYAIMGKDHTSHVSPYYIYALHYNSASGLAFCAASISNNFTNSTAVNIGDLTNSFHHYFCVKDENEIKLFIDGKMVSKGPSVGLIDNNNVSLKIGANLNFSRYVNMYADDILVINRPLENFEVSLIYNRQKQKYASHYDSEVIDLGNVTSTWPDLSWSTNLPFGKELVGDFDSNGNPDSESSSDYSGLSGDLSDGLVGYWPLEERSLDTLSGNLDFSDQSSLANHCEHESGTLGYQGVVGHHLLLGRANCGSIHDFSGQVPYSISAWFKTSLDTSGQFFNILKRRKNPGSGLEGWTCFTSGINGQLSCNRTVNGAQFPVVSTEALNDGRWHHFVHIYDGAQKYLYIDGKLDGSSVATSIISDGGGNFIIGDNGENGSVDEAAVWNRALNATEVQQLYRRGANRVKLQVKSCVDSSCNCKSYGAGGSETDCDGDGTLNTADNDDSHKSEFIGPGGDGTTYYSELYNRSETDITFNCALNTSDNNPGVCVGDEITLAGSSKPTGPEFLNIDYTQFVNPSPNRYAQYRVYMEADDNTACGGEPCLPELSSVSLNPNNETKYANDYIEVKPKSPINFTMLFNAKIVADSCATFRLARDTDEYYHDGTQWTLVTDVTHRNIASDLTDNIVQFQTQYGTGSLQIKGYLKSNTSQSSQCTIDEIDINYK